MPNQVVEEGRVPKVPMPVIHASHLCQSSVPVIHASHICQSSVPVINASHPCKSTMSVMTPMTMPFLEDRDCKPFSACFFFWSLPLLKLDASEQLVLFIDWHFGSKLKRCELKHCLDSKKLKFLNLQIRNVKNMGATFWKLLENASYLFFVQIQSGFKVMAVKCKTISIFLPAVVGSTKIIVCLVSILGTACPPSTIDLKSETQFWLKFQRGLLLLISISIYQMIISQSPRRPIWRFCRLRIFFYVHGFN